MAKYAQGKFTPKNITKYIGKGIPTYRSSWEMMFMTFLDNNPSIQQWCSEGIKIPYYNPVIGKQSIYVPDFLIVYIDAHNQTHGEIIEIKPSHETVMENARSLRDKMVIAINLAKWQSAKIWCSSHGLKFRVVTEQNLFHQGAR